MDALVLANLVLAAFLAGLVWFVQVVHYPLLAAVGPGAFPAYHAAHRRRTGWVVAAPMVAELGLAAALALADPGVLSGVALALVLVVWASTFAAQVPDHAALERDGLVPARHRRLVRGNAVRTAAWTARVAVLTALALA